MRSLKGAVLYSRGLWGLGLGFRVFSWFCCLVFLGFYGVIVGFDG